jgi:RNA polymerase sigma factor (sigma-70 family)
MPVARLDGVLGAAFSYLRLDPRPDAELLTRFLEERDETAFEALVARHTPAVRAACRSWLRSAADIDDAAQATFLILVQRAKSIRNRAVLGRWLYGVAANVARRLQRRRRAYAPMPNDVPGPAPAVFSDVPEMLAEEVARLPERYRLPVQLCYWAGLTTTEAAQRLGWPKGTVLTRLAWARQRLQKNLVRRGVAPALLPAMAAAQVPVVRDKWVRATARAGKDILAGEAPARVGVSGRTISLMEGVTRAMMWNRLKYVALAALVAIGLAGYGVRQWVAASDDQGNGRWSMNDPTDKRAGNSRPSAAPKENPRADDSKPGPTARRREAIIRVPSGTFVREIDAPAYGSGRLTWTYEEERVLGLIEGTVMGFEFELATEAEYSLSSNGTIYGLLTSVRLNHLRLPQDERFGDLNAFVAAAEPLVNDVLLDLPFSYQFRLQGDRLVISNFRCLLAGPNPLGKVGGLMANGNSGFEALVYFQALGAAIEGTYTVPDGRDRPTPTRRPLFVKPRGRTDARPVH